MNRPLESLVEGPGWVGIMSQWVMWKVFHLGEFLDPEGTPRWLWRRGQKRPAGLKAIAGIGYKRSSDHARVLCKRWGIPYVALEDGFLRSSSLGVEGDTPMSMVVDPIGIHYLADRPSLLENILQQPDNLSAADLDTARELIALMRSSGIGKYNNAPDLSDDDPLGRDRPLVLVVGCVKPILSACSTRPWRKIPTRMCGCGFTRTASVATKRVACSMRRWPVALRWRVGMCPGRPWRAGRGGCMSAPARPGSRR
jgi:hypothetical protein